MGRKDRSRCLKNLRRRGPSRRPRAAVLIVCEGAETEPRYFRSLRRRLKLTTTEVEVADDSGSAPTSVVNTAQARQKQRRRDAKRDPALVEYDEVWCVMDVEVPEHPSLAEAVDKARKLPKTKVTLSNPCFEFWYLLHFERTGRQFQGCASVIHRLKNHLPDYEKGDECFEKLYHRTGTAVTRASNLFLQQWQNEGNPRRCNPCTQVHELVERLHAIVGASLPRQP